MRKGLLAICIAMFTVSLTSSFAAEIGFEAEDANVIEAPMKLWSVGEKPFPNDEGASGDMYISITESNLGFAEYVLNIPEDENWYVWYRNACPMAGDDSTAHITWDTEDSPQRGQQPGGDLNVFSITPRGPEVEWTWDKIVTRNAEDKWDLDLGEHKLRIWGREKDGYFDCFYMSTNSNASPKLPSELPPPSKAVKAGGKLSITWGRIKAQ